jgi:hypothetical protein
LSEEVGNTYCNDAKKCVGETNGEGVETESSDEGESEIEIEREGVVPVSAEVDQREELAPLVTTSFEDRVGIIAVRNLIPIKGRGDVSELVETEKGSEEDY